MRRINRNIYITIPFNENDLKGSNFCYYTGIIIKNDIIPVDKIDQDKDLVITTLEQLKEIHTFKGVNVYSMACDQVEYIINTW